MSGPCAKQRVRAEIVTPGGERFFGENLCYRPQQTCPRGAMKTGTGYHLCRSICVQSGHAEINALAAAGDKASGATLILHGHTYDCDDCRTAAEAAGIREIIIAPPEHAVATRPRLIGFCGLAGAGKSFAAKHLVRDHGFARERLAEPIKAMLRALGLSEAELDGDLKEKPCEALCGQTPRVGQQTIGTEWGREMIGREIWVRAWGRRADRILEAGGSVVVDDVRFADEAAAIWRRGGILIRVERLGAGSATGSGHISELGGFPYDYGVTNPGEDGPFRTMLDHLLTAGVLLKHWSRPKQSPAQ